jgi:ribosomal protein S18 acetylase RimI-like enzyme
MPKKFNAIRFYLAMTKTVFLSKRHDSNAILSPIMLKLGYKPLGRLYFVGAVKMEIRKYTKEDEAAIMKLIEAEGQGWEYYLTTEVSEKYKSALVNSITYVAYEGETLCGYSRSINDGGFYIYICDLLVDVRFRGQKIGQKLIEQVCLDYPGQTIIVMSNSDGFYIKKGYHREGSIFRVKIQ